MINTLSNLLGRMSRQRITLVPMALVQYLALKSSEILPYRLDIKGSPKQEKDDTVMTLVGKCMLGAWAWSDSSSIRGYCGHFGQI